MARFADPRLLQRVAEAEAKLVRGWREGVSLEARSGHTLDELQQKVAAQRIGLANDFLARGRLLLLHNPPLYRDATSRFYYAAYHAFRSVTYFATGGDDHEGHSELPTRLPTDFPRHTLWSNDLKSARELRNAADYNLYPKSWNAWRGHCSQVETIAEGAVAAARSYLRSKGCMYV
jgi:uncharacterized protein (UPF0332 family)